MASESIARTGRTLAAAVATLCATCSGTTLADGGTVATISVRAADAGACSLGIPATVFGGKELRRLEHFAFGCDAGAARRLPFAVGTAAPRRFDPCGLPDRTCASAFPAVVAVRF